MPSHFVKSITAIISTSLLVACSSMHSERITTELNEIEYREGLVYYMPKKDVVFTVTVTVDEERTKAERALKIEQVKNGGGVSNS